MNRDSISVLNGIVTACFIGTWFVLAVVSFLFLDVGRDAGFKRRWFSRFMILGSVLFVLFATTMMVLQSRSAAGLAILVPVVPMVILISWLNIRFTKFCDKCGATLHDYNWFSPMTFCSKCGAELDPKPPVNGDLLE